MDATYAAWLEAHGVVAPDVRVHVFPTEGRGLQAVRPLPAGATVLRVPASACLSTASALASARLPLPPAARAALRPDDLLALHLLYSDDAAPHVAAQPAHVHNALAWTDAERARLAGSNLAALAARIQSQAREDHAEVNAVLSVHGAETLAWERYAWALALVWSRAMDLVVPSKPETRRRMLVPLVEMANHAPEARVEHAFTDDETAVVVTTLEPVPEGAQFFLFYGGIANIDLLRLYGFALRDNPHDRVDIWAPLNPNDPLFPLRRQALAKFGIQHDGPFPLTESVPIPAALVAAVRIQMAPRETVLSILSGDASILDPLAPEIETAIVTALRDAVEGMLAGYPTSLGADVRALADPALAPGSFEQHALFLLIGEKKVLVRAFASLEKALAAASR